MIIGKFSNGFGGMFELSIGPIDDFKEGPNYLTIRWKDIFTIQMAFYPFFGYKKQQRRKKAIEKATGGRRHK